MDKRDKEMRAEGVAKRDEWLAKNGFIDGVTYVLKGDTYPIKDELKAAGWRFDKTLLWHCGNPGERADNCIKVTVDEAMEFDVFGRQFYKAGFSQKIKDAMYEKVESNSEYIGEVKQRLRDIPLTLVSTHSFDGMYGPTAVYTFEDEDENIFTWFTTKYLGIDNGTLVTLTGTVKEHKEYRGVKQTVLTRCTIK